MIRNVSPGDVAKILAAHRAAERSKAIDGLGYLRSVQDDEPVEVIPTEAFEYEDDEQKEFEEFLKLIGAITLAGILDEAENKKEVHRSKASVLQAHQEHLDARKSKRKASELIQMFQALIG